MYRKINSIEELNVLFRQPTAHPLVTMGDLAQADLSLFQPTDFGMYCVVLIEENFGSLIKGGKAMRYRAGTAFSLRPGQVVSMDLDWRIKPQGRMLAFRPELLEKCGLGRDFYMFGFFDSDVAEALELSATERGVLLNCFANIQTELHTPPDYLSTHMIRLGIGHLLSYCKRFFERQFHEQKRVGENFASRIDETVDRYLSSGMPAQHGHPTVAWCAEQFNFSPNYFGELVKREMHITAQEYISSKIVAAAQTLLRDSLMSIGEIAEELGFAYPNHFSRMFTRRTGISPLAFRKMQNKKET